MTTPEQFLATFREDIRDICLDLRLLVMEVLPEAEEILFEGYKNLSYGTGESRNDRDLICYIAPFKTSANLGFYRGTLLPDPHELLTGTGKLLRHVKFTRREQTNDDRVRELLIAARQERLGH